MGYSTDFEGSFNVSPAMDGEMVEYLDRFASVRHMRRDNEVIMELFPDWQDLCAGGELGVEGEYFVGGDGFAGQDRDDSILDYNYPPSTQPGLWCQWVPTADGCAIEWDQGEKFYEYVDWLKYLIDNFLAPNGYTVNGEVEWYGEDRDDIGKIVVEDNDVRVVDAEIHYNY